MSDRNSDFEEEYTLKFKQLVVNFGEFLKYERDHSQRDIGLHLKVKTDRGSISGSSVVFFQLKGLQATTISKSELEKKGSVSVTLKTPHLINWYRYSEPTYLAVYCESLEKFYYLNIKKWVNEKYGQKILEKTEKTEDISIPISEEYLLDGGALNKIFVEGEKFGWESLVGDLKLENKSVDEHISFFEDCIYQHNLIRKVSDITSQGGKVSVLFRDRLSKTRSEVHFFKKDSKEEIHQRWQHMFTNMETFGSTAA